VFEVKTRKAHGSDGGVLTPMGRMNISDALWCVPQLPMSAITDLEFQLAWELVLYS
jgi:hypothetical protein